MSWSQVSLYAVRSFAEIYPTFEIQVDHWLEFTTSRLGCASEFGDALVYLDRVLGPITYLVGHDVTLADFVVWGFLRGMWEHVCLHSHPYFFLTSLKVRNLKFTNG